MSASLQRWINTEKPAVAVLSMMLASLALDIRFLTSICTLLLPLMIVLFPQRRERFARAFTQPLFIGFLLLFLVVLSGIFYTTDPAMQWWELNKKASLLAIPFFFAAWGDISPSGLHRIVRIFTAALVLASLICLVLAGIKYNANGDAQVFFYHPLVAPLEHHAVFFSFFLFFCIVYWLEDGARLQLSRLEKRLWNLALLFFLGLILLLSSKLVLGLTIVYLAFYIVRTFVNKRRRWLLPVFSGLLFAAVLILALTQNPVRKRFEDLYRGDAKLFTKEQFHESDYFNGLQFRLLNWRLTTKILQSKHAWVAGVSPGSAQHQLDSAYLASGIYMGDVNRGDSGFKGFNCHNLYLQVLLESGLIGLSLLLIIVFLFIRQTIRRKRLPALLFFLAIAIFGLVESVLSTQFAIFLFTLLPLMLLSRKRTY